MRAHGHPSNEPRAIAAALPPSATGATGLLTDCVAWAEEHWEMVGITVSIVCAVTVATVLAVTFNILFT